MTIRRATSLRPGQFKHLIRVASVTGRLPERDVMLLWVTHTTGIRVTELALLEIGDVLYPSGAIKSEVYLRADITKGCRPRNVYLTHARCLAALDAWLAVRLRRRWGLSGADEYRGFRPGSKLVMTHKGQAFELAFKHWQLDTSICTAPVRTAQPRTSFLEWCKSWSQIKTRQHGEKAAMTFDSAMKTFIRPVTIACDDDYYQFIGSGTAFICQYRGQVFVVCARHTWENMGITIENFRIFIPGYDWALPFDYEAVFGPEERSDLKVLRVDSQIMASNPPALMRALDLNSFIVPAEDFKKDSVFLAVGYPQCRREFHYDTKRFVADLAAFSGPLVGELTDAVITMCTDFGHVDDIDGLSGSPVFISGDPHLFAGVVIRAGQDAGLIHFIHGACLIHAMDALVELPPRLMMN